MTKPTTVKTVEALGWAYVVLAALAGLDMVYVCVSDMLCRIKLAGAQARYEHALPPEDCEVKPGMAANYGAVGKVLCWLKAT